MEPDDLYGLAFERFVPERTTLAKALRADKRRDEAAAVAALRKPSVTAWAVNQLVRTQGSAIGELYEAGDALRSAQADLLAGSGDGRTLRAANERERAAVDALVERARGLLSSEGQELSATVVERVADTLHAAALDEGARQQVRGGCLERELRHVGLGLGESPAPVARPAKPASDGAKAAKPQGTAAPAAAGAEAAKPQGAAAPAAGGAEAAKPQGTAAPPAAGAKPATEPKPATKAKPDAAERERLKAKRGEEERLRRERDEARKAARAAEATARRRAERAARALRNAEERRDRAAQAVAEAEEALGAAREEARDADAEHERARAELEREAG